LIKIERGVQRGYRISLTELFDHGQYFNVINAKHHRGNQPFIHQSGALASLRGTGGAGKKIGGEEQKILSPTYKMMKNKIRIAKIIR
jgi:hypothetical protein